MIPTFQQRFPDTGSLWSGLMLSVATFICGHGVSAESPGDNAAATGDRVAQTLRISTAAARRYDFRLAGTPPRKLELHPASILNWSNPVAGEVYGNVFLWTDRGRPQLIGSIFQWYSPMTHGSHEFHSLSTDPLTGSRDGTRVWESPTAGVTWHPVPDAPAVATTPAQRLRHARAISRGFEIEKTDREGVSRQLRLLAQPIFRYGDESQGVPDGMLFVFVQGTDPEVFLMIEAERKGTQPQWNYALARMNSVQFVATYQDREVWRTEIWPWSRVKNGREVYTTIGPFELDPSK